MVNCIMVVFYLSFTMVVIHILPNSLDYATSTVLTSN